MKKERMHKSTMAIHGGRYTTQYGEISVPIFQSSTFAFENAAEGAARFSGDQPGYIYTRMANPTVQTLEDCIATLEGGYRGMATASGMAAVTTVFLALLGQGNHVVATNSIYGPTRTVLETQFSRFGVESTFVDTSNPQWLRESVRPNTRVIFIETPANPTITLTDLRAAAAVARDHDALLIVDNTFAGPHLQRPIEYGADVVVHSTTKSINGHSDVVGGMIVPKNEVLYRRVKPVLNLFGGTMDPHQAWLILRGVRTMPLRVEKAQKNAEELALFLQQHPKVAWVRYPGLPDHPQHDVARQQMDGFGFMISAGVKNGMEGGRAVMDHVRLFTLAVSLGGVESLIEHPASMTHAGVPKHERQEAGILDELVRISVGCEDVNDLREDLDQALRTIPV